MRIYLLIFISLLIGACTKAVDTVYYKKEDLTRFTTRPFMSDDINKEIKLVAVKECSGKVICTDKEIKLTITHSGRFTFFRGKDLVIKTERGQIELNQRDYSYTYDALKLSNEGTSGLLTEKYLIWLSETDFIKAAHAKDAKMHIGNYVFELPVEGRDSWQVMMDKARLLEIMDEEQQREYGKYPHVNSEKKEMDLREKRMLSEAAESTWEMIENSNSPEDFRYFIEQFPNSPYSIPAKLKLKKLNRANQ